MENLFSFLKGGLNQQNRVLFFLNLFYFIVSETSAVRLLREEGQRLPVLALNDMGLKKRKIRFFQAFFR